MQVAQAHRHAGDDAVVQAVECGRGVVPFERVLQVDAQFLGAAQRGAVDQAAGEHGDIVAAVDELAEGLLEAGRRAHFAIAEMAAFPVARQVQRREDFLAQRRGAFEEAANAPFALPDDDGAAIGNEAERRS